MPQLLLFPDPRPLVERLGADFFRQAPNHPGVYLMRDASDTVLYVGKAKSLRKRLGIANGAPVLVVLPGSRSSEVKRLMAPFGEGMRRLLECVPSLEVILPPIEAATDNLDSVRIDPRAFGVSVKVVPFEAARLMPELAGAGIALASVSRLSRLAGSLAVAPVVTVSAVEIRLATG